ncbi:S8 family serine peptidase [Luteolibacter sp. GHJ8]|uniref:S8 family serine peptidase n=1 Tax=Luteolibacter rhizosphaerae TaxID=2989719 RepID=A0ABT3G827_9BACT|nr:S8 family serine peptidase [Luteolibacter rhizosphaerae]MCW1916012.1 S8 family serine peptidase [Luteolibacter rhizosphaerae]
MKKPSAGIPGFVVASCLLVSTSLPGQDAFYYDGPNKVALKQETDWTAYELAAGSDPSTVEAEVRKSALKGQNRTAVFDPKRRFLAVPAENATTPKGALRKVRLFKNGTADPIMETRELVVRFKDGVTRKQIERILKPLRGTILSAIGDYAPNAYLVEVPAEISSIDTANRLQLMPEVRYAQPDLIWPKVQRFVPNDPMYPQQWHLNNPGGNDGLVGADIKAERAWEITRGSSDVIIAILDDGVATGHEDFASGKFTGGWDFISNDNDPRPARTVDNHGTSCAGLAAASGNNGLGVTGVAPDCRLMAVRMLGVGSTPTVEAAAIAHAKNNGAWVISNSWGPADGTGSNDPCPQVVNDAIVDAADNGRGGKGCVILWAAGNGNESSDLDGYASHPKVICVAATLRNDTRSPYSDFGNGVDICAPGGSGSGDMVTVDRMGSAGYNPSSNYHVGFNGTSSATPVAAGVAALILSAQPTLTRQQVTTRLINSSDHIDTGNVTYDGNGHHNWYGYGRVNAFAALAAADSTAPTVAVQVPAQGQIATTIPLASGTTSDTGYGTYLIHWWVHNAVTGKWWNPNTSSWQDGTGSGATVAPTGNNWSISLPATGEGSYQLHVKAEDKAGNESAFIIREYQIDNGSPSLTISTPAAGNQATSPSTASGTASDSGSGVKEIRVSLRSVSTDRWFKWSNSSWTGSAFAWADHVALASGTTSWSKSLPVLPEGSYELFIQALDNSDAPSAWTPRSFSIDGADPVVAFNGLINQQQIFDFRNVSGSVSEPATVTVKLTEFNTSGTNRYWNGSTWTSNEADPGVWRPATVSGNSWQPQTALPSRSSTRAGHYILEAKAVDVANKQDLESLVLIRSATDTTIPNLAIASPVNGTVLAEPVLPALNGTASDPESGISGVSLYVMRSTGSGFTYWTGSGWSLTPTELPANSNGSNWSAPLMSGPGAWSMPSYGQLVNGSWQIQVSARNGEIPAGTRGATVAFTLDYHPVYEFTAGSYSDGDDNNNNMLFSNPANWAPYGVPGANDIASLPYGHNVTSTSNLTLYGLRMSSGSLNFSEGPGANGTLVTTGKSEWSGGTFNGWWTQNGTLQLTGAERWLWLNSRLSNNGTTTWTTGRTIGRESATIINSTGATWILGVEGDAFGNYYGGNQFINQGILRHTQVGETVLDDWSYTLGNEVQKQGGTLIVNSPVTLNAGTQFTGGGAFRQNGGTVSISGTIASSTGSFTVAGGTLNATSESTLMGVYQWSGGDWSGNLTIPVGSDLSITGDCQLNAGAILHNEGTVHWNSASPLRGRENVTVNNKSGATWRLESTGDAFSNYYGGNVFNNSGLLTKTGSGTTFLQHWTYSCPGDTRVNTGTLRVVANLTLPANATLSGPGTLEYGGGTLALQGEIQSSVSTLKLMGGTMNCASGAKIQGNWTWNGGAIGGTLENPLTRQITIEGDCQLNTAANLSNKGTVVWKAGSPLRAWEHVTITNHPGATWEFATAGDAFSQNYGVNQFFNQGLLKRSAASGNVVLDDWTFHHSGVFDSSAGTTQIGSPLNLLAGGFFTGAGAFSFHSTTTLKGPTTFTADTTVAGGSFNGEAAGRVIGALKWSTATFTGVTNVSSGSSLRLVTTESKLLADSATLDIAGELVWETGDLTGREHSRFIIRNGGVFRILGTGTLANYYYDNHVVIEDGGTLLKTSSGESAIHWALDNDGSAQVSAGLLSAHGGGTGDGSFTGSTGGLLRFANGPHVLETGASLSGGTEITGGSLIATGNAGGRIDIKGGTLGSDGTATFAFAGSSAWTGGSLHGLLSVPNGASLASSGPDFKGLNHLATLNVGGLLQWDGGATIQGRESSTISIESSGMFRTTADGDVFSNYYGGNRLLLSGTLEKSNGSGVSFFDEWLVEGSGTIRPLTGSIDFHATVNLFNGAKFDGGGQTRLNAGPTTVQGWSTIYPGATVRFGGADIVGHTDGSGGFTGGAIEWTAGTLHRRLTFNSNLAMTGAAGKGIWAGAELRNMGTLTLGGSGGLQGREASTVRNLTGGTLLCPGTSHLSNYYGGNALINEGSMSIGSPFHGRQTMEWRFQQTASGVLNVTVGGENAATPDFDFLQAWEGMQLGGKLVVTKTGGYVPAENTTFGILNTGYGISGTFTSLQAPGFGIEYSGTAALLRAGNSGVGFEQWATSKGLSGPNAQSNADPDKDGVVNFLEYAFNSDPAVRSANPVNSSVVTINDQKWIVVGYRTWNDRINAGLGYNPERSPGLSGWNTTGMIDEVDTAAPAIPGSTARRCRIPMSGAKDFMRIRVE